ncbi:hypothetical protein AB0Y38_08995 [Lysinibacillus capsici]|uniref:hypothetical protein n=1 Tax=Lysinibacillus capsici TaxID=2115968 RepID=UPI003F20A3FA
MSEQRFFQELETRRLKLRNVNREDLDFIFKLFSDEKVCEFLYDEEIFTKKEERELL